ncbi:hypothetical protein ACFY4C_37345 [Actinomadura viridis]|uniref:hypothetical protein n=1 Tax=Actinomadura viridis TaxID=58110 RepID=UPI0036A6196A
MKVIVFAFVIGSTVLAAPRFISRWLADAEADRIPHSCEILKEHANGILGAKITSEAEVENKGTANERRCTLEKATIVGINHLQLEYFLYRRSDGVAGIEMARKGLQTRIQTAKMFPSATKLTKVQSLGDEAYLLVGKLDETSALTTTTTTVITRTVNVVIKVRATGRETNNSATQPALQRLAAEALAQITTK